MTVNAPRKVLSAKPNKLYKKRIGLRDIKAVGLRENYAILIDNKYHKEMCPMLPLELWIKVKNYYPIGTRIEREFTKDSSLIYDAIVTDIDLKTKRHKLNWDDKNQIQKSKTTIPVARYEYITTQKIIKNPNWREDQNKA